MAQQIDGTVNEHPPEVRVLALKEQVDTRLNANLGTAVGQFRELIVGQAVEEADSAKLARASDRGQVGSRFAHEIQSGRLSTVPAAMALTSWAWSRSF